MNLRRRSAATALERFLAGPCRLHFRELPVALALALALLTSLAGACSTDGDGANDADASLADASGGDDVLADASADDAEDAEDADEADSAGADVGESDTNDAGESDADSPDADLSDADRPDADPADADLPDADLPDADLPDPIDDLGDWVPPGDLSLPPQFVPEADEFLVAIIPDTQIYSERVPETFETMMRWIAEHAEEYRIVFVSHVGDIVQSANAEDQWQAARAAYAWVQDIGLPHGFALGSHDLAPMPGADSSCTSRRENFDCEATAFRENFGPEFYADASWYRGTSPTELSNYQVVQAGDLQLLFLHITMDTPTDEVAWAQTVIDAHPNALAHVTTHRYLYDYRLTTAMPFPLGALSGGRFNTLTYTLGSQGLVYDTSMEAEQFFFDFVRANPNIWAVHCGHVDAEFQQVSTNIEGEPIYEMLLDWQNMADGGGGWFRLLLYKPSEDRVEAITFSPLTGEIRRDGDGFDHAIGILDAYRNSVEGELRDFGLDPEDLEALLVEIQEGGPLRQEYYDSLYSGGKRQSLFAMDVDFSAYTGVDAP